MDDTTKILLVWFGFPLLAFALAWLYGRRIRLKPVKPEPRKTDDFITFVPSTYAYYPDRRGGEEPALPQPATGGTRQKDAVLATLAVVCGAAGLYLPLVGFFPGVAAMLLARPVMKRDNHYSTRAASSWMLGVLCLVQLYLYIMAAM